MKYNHILRILVCVCLLCGLLLSVAACAKEPEDDGYYTVAFDTAGGSQVPAQEIKAGGYAKQPPTPTKEGYIFLGWKRDTFDYDFDSFPVNRDTTLVASWIEADDLFSYERITGTDEFRITGLTRHDLTVDTLYLPQMTRGMAVTGIAANAFASLSHENIPNIVIPNNINSVGEGAFYQCDGIRIQVLGTLKEVGKGAFFGCNGLVSVALTPGMTSIPWQAFSGCSSLLTVQIPNGIKNIEENAFTGCTSLVTVVLPTGLERIEDSTFYECNSIKTVFFMGSAEEELAALVGNGNDALIEAKRYHYSAEEPSESGAFWYWDDQNNPKIWIK